MNEHRALIKQLKALADKNEVHIEGNIKIPEIYLNKEKGILQINGRSLPENAKELYMPILDWLDQYLASPQDLTTVIFKLEYFNTASSKMLTELISRIKQLKKLNHNINIEWHYPFDDEDMLDSGETLEEVCGLQFHYYPYHIHSA